MGHLKCQKNVCVFSGIWENVHWTFGGWAWATENVPRIWTTTSGPQKMSTGFRGHPMGVRKCLLGHLKCQKMSFGTFKMSKSCLCALSDLGKCQPHILLAGPTTRPRSILCNPAASVPCTLPSLTSVSRLQVSAFGSPELVSQILK